MAKVLVTAPSGQRGTALVSALRRRGHTVRVLETAAASAAAPHQPASDLEVVVGDLTRPADVDAAIEGVDAVVLQLPVTVAQPGIGGTVAAAAARVGAQLVFLAHGPVTAADDAPSVAPVMHAIDQAVRLGPAGGTTVRVPLYLGNLIGPWTAPGVAHGELAYPLPPEARVAWTSAEDVAELLAALVGREGFDAKVVDAGGQTPLDGNDLAGAFSKALGRPIQYRALTADEFVARLQPIFGDAAAEQVAELYRRSDAPWSQEFLAIEGGKLAADLGVVLTPVEEWVRAQAWPGL